MQKECRKSSDGTFKTFKKRNKPSMKKCFSVMQLDNIYYRYGLILPPSIYGFGVQFFLFSWRYFRWHLPMKDAIKTYHQQLKRMTFVGGYYSVTAQTCFKQEVERWCRLYTSQKQLVSIFLCEKWSCRYFNFFVGINTVNTWL